MVEAILHAAFLKLLHMPHDDLEDGIFGFAPIMQADVPPDG